MSERQKCPVCNGSGAVSRPPWVAGDQDAWSSICAGPYPCNCCSGAGVIEMPVKEDTSAFCHWEYDYE